jgi:hypothetical protein
MTPVLFRTSVRICPLRGPPGLFATKISPAEYNVSEEAKPLSQGESGVPDGCGEIFGALQEIEWVLGRTWVVPKGVPSFCKEGVGR